jgi:hypothetical protein
MRTRVARLEAVLTPAFEFPRAVFASDFGDAGVIYDDGSKEIAPWVGKTLVALLDAAPAGWPLKLYGFDPRAEAEVAERRAALGLDLKRGGGL